ncbi:hypothetical protein HKX48_007123 [Thoreauomyces humboldtii]|nr:hypothetical protein HKX48_007123 [Thoreauomyces humboldtii]
MSTGPESVSGPAAASEALGGAGKDSVTLGADASSLIPEAKWNNKAPKYFDVGNVGRRTGVKAPENPKLDANGLMMVDQMWEDDLTVQEPSPGKISTPGHERSRSSSLARSTPKAAEARVPVEKQTPRIPDVPNPVIASSPLQRTSKASSPAPKTPARNAVAGMPRPSMAPNMTIPPLSPSEAASTPASAPRYSTISNSSIVDEDIPSPVDVLSPARPFRLSSIGTASPSPAESERGGRVPPRTPAGQRPPHPLSRVTRGSAYDEYPGNETEDDASPFGGPPPVSAVPPAAEPDIMDKYIDFPAEQDEDASDKETSPVGQAVNGRKRKAGQREAGERDLSSSKNLPTNRQQVPSMHGTSSDEHDERGAKLKVEVQPRVRPKVPVKTAKQPLKTTRSTSVPRQPSPSDSEQEKEEEEEEKAGVEENVVKLSRRAVISDSDDDERPVPIGKNAVGKSAQKTKGRNNNRPAAVPESGAEELEDMDDAEERVEKREASPEPVPSFRQKPQKGKGQPSKRAPIPPARSPEPTVESSDDADDNQVDAAVARSRTPGQKQNGASEKGIAKAKRRPLGNLSVSKTAVKRKWSEKRDASPLPVPAQEAASELEDEETMPDQGDAAHEVPGEQDALGDDFPGDDAQQQEEEIEGDAENDPVVEFDADEVQDEHVEEKEEVEVKPRKKKAPASRKGKAATSGNGRRKTPAQRQTRLTSPPPDDEPASPAPSDSNNVRRSKRMRMSPLKFWANEHIVYGRRESGYCPVPVIKEVIKVESSDDETASAPSRKRARKTTSRREEPMVQPDMKVVNVATGEEEDQRIVATPEMLNPKTTGAGDYKFQKVFSEGNFFASGMLVLPKGSQKPNKNSQSSAMIFVVLSGEIEVQVHKTLFVVRTGSQFFVPRGNQYRISNISNREAKIFFAHGREVTAEEVG